MNDYLPATKHQIIGFIIYSIAHLVGGFIASRIKKVEARCDLELILLGLKCLLLLSLKLFQKESSNGNRPYSS